MLRVALRAFVLLIMFLLLFVGSKTSMCMLLSTAGFAPHHHVIASDEGPAQSICLTDDVSLGDRNTAPCTENCLFHLASATSPTTDNLPSPSVANAPINRPDSPLCVEPDSQIHFTPSFRHSPDLRKRLLASPSVTGRFLI